ncbi:hypothetical protein [Paraburkholderia sediminicola]|uniref:hypothetical protein n=1 Tax=Paraburkholderia sediminicola TaxID=458836 RepID=UPI0038BA0436
MAIECLLTGTVTREARLMTSHAQKRRYVIAMTVVDFLGSRCYVDCSSDYPATTETLKSLQLGDVIAVRGHVAVTNKSRANKNEAGCLKVSITGLMTLEMEQ